MDGLCKCCHGLFRRFCGQSMKNGLFINGMRLVVSFLNICPLYLVNYELNTWMPNETDQYVFAFMLNAALFMALLSYWTASLKRPRKIPEVAGGSHVDMCGQCRNWKPERAHHCQYCGVCVPKMDHHCPWIGNCVGYHNMKPFFLFCFYQALGACVFAWMATLRALYAPDKTPELSAEATFCWWLTVVIDMPIGFALIGLSLNIFV